MIHDIFIPFVAEKFEEMGFTKLSVPDKVVLIYDHLVPASAVEDIRHFKIGDAFVKKYGLKNIHRSDGICHQLMTECGYAKPGEHRIWNRLTYDHLRMRWLLFVRHWVHRNGINFRNRRNVGQSTRKQSRLSSMANFRTMYLPKTLF